MLAQSFGQHAMLKNAIAALILVAALPAVAAEQIKVAGDGTISLGEWGKVLNSVVFACKSPSDPAIYGSLMVQMHSSVELKCNWSELPKRFHDVIRVRPHEEQNCLLVFKLGIVSTYDRGEIGTEEMLSLSNKFFDHIHPECEGWPESTNLPAHCY
jgi:hypothetical protein